MKFSLPTLAVLLPLAAQALAMPAPEAAPAPAAIADNAMPAPPDNNMPAPDVDADADPEVSIPLESPESLGLTKRANTVCKIVNSASASVKCRSGPGFSYGVTAYVIPGKNYQFNCYKSGDCYEGNCTWQRINWDGKSCYVNGYYTDSKCTVAALGKC
ncbi:uncharacterized protein DSM5745_05182 [Aspergillus mulundensis]|uniref:SH3 domain-containing protein n=1 Tax=Aspergillus mulundensis TaxID=1810919 RepID=A0A3D8S5N2_9EURO|nr:Uncharacterized protein DSM5745_05182 [Aspergillus mulundensis]RDW81625.1 Uncharacterized protein DSM5745_05182 [Aspergillus mulundensis]